MIFFLISLLIREDLPNKPPQIHRELSTEAAKIIRVIVEERLGAKGDAPPGNYLVVVDHTLTFCPELPEEKQQPPCIPTSMAPPFSSKAVLPLVPSDLKDRLVRENPESVPLRPLHMPAAKLVPRQTLTEIFATKGWWSEFYRRFPHSRGYLEVTKPTFSADNMNALVYVSHSCGGLCGTGWVMYLARINGAWRIVDKYMVWIS